MNFVAGLITLLFGVFIGGMLLLKWHDPQLDTTFIGTISLLVMGMANFLYAKFASSKIEHKVEMAAADLATTTMQTAADLKQDNSTVIANQTSELKDAITEKKEEIVQEIKTSVS